MKKLLHNNLQAHIQENGGKYITDTSAYAGNWAAIFAHTATVISTVTCDGLKGTTTSIDVPAGTTYQFPGGATTVTLASGKATLYNL